MPDWLSEEWAVAVGELASALPDIPEGSGSVALAIATARRKEVAIHWRYEEGHASEGGAGSVAEPDLALSIQAAEAAQLVKGEVEPSVAFMRGRLKATGDGKLLIGFLESTTRPEFEKWRRRVEALGTPEPAGAP